MALKPHFFEVLTEPNIYILEELVGWDKNSFPFKENKQFSYILSTFMSAFYVKIITVVRAVEQPFFKYFFF